MEPQRGATHRRAAPGPPAEPPALGCPSPSSHRGTAAGVSRYGYIRWKIEQTAMVPPPCQQPRASIWGEKSFPGEYLKEGEGRRVLLPCRERCKPRPEIERKRKTRNVALTITGTSCPKTPSRVPPRCPRAAPPPGRPARATTPPWVALREGDCFVPKATFSFAYRSCNSCASGHPSAPVPPGRLLSLPASRGGEVPGCPLPATDPPTAKPPPPFPFAAPE